MAQQASPPSNTKSSALPEVQVIQAEPTPDKKPKKKAENKPGPKTARVKNTAEPPAQEAAPNGQQGEGQTIGSAANVPGVRSGSLTVPTTSEARTEIQRTPGGVELVPGSDYQASTPSTTLQDALDYVPGVFVQTKWGDDTRLSIRGSSLSRNYHLRSIELYMDGIPINTADGYGDFQEIDPTAYRYIEVYKGANALRFGANSLGGAINFVMPTGYDSDLFGARVDVGSFGFHQLSVNSGGVYGAVDYFINGTVKEQDGFRDHSNGDSVRGSFNIGYRLSEDVETRFYVNANEVRQRIPGEVTRSVALESPETAAAINVQNDWQRNIDTLRVANKTAIRLAPETLLEFGAFGVDRHLMHPIYLWLDYQYNDYGGFARLQDRRVISGFANEFVGGVNLHNGTIGANLYGIGPGAAKGPLIISSDQRAENISAYFENTFYFLPDVGLVAGTQFLHAEREQDGIQNAVSGQTVFDLWSPKVGVLWNVDPSWQVFANVSRSAEVPSFDEGSSTSNFTDIRAQQATTYELGTRGRKEDLTWDLSVYRANIKDELQCLGDGTDFCSVVNADRTIHQGVEAGLGIALWKSVFVAGPHPDLLWLNSSYTFNDFRFDNDPVFANNELPGAPHHFLRSELLYKHPSGVYLGPNLEWVPEAYCVDNANTVKTAAYALLGAKIGYDTPKFSAYLEGRNLTNEVYISNVDIASKAFANSALFWPGEGRGVYGGIQVKW